MDGDPAGSRKYIISNRKDVKAIYIILHFMYCFDILPTKP